MFLPSPTHMFMKLIFMSTRTTLLHILMYKISH
jgi:hypothetical protein